MGRSRTIKKRGRCRNKAHCRRRHHRTSVIHIHIHIHPTSTSTAIPTPIHVTPTWQRRRTEEDRLWTRRRIWWSTVIGVLGLGREMFRLAWECPTDHSQKARRARRHPPPQQQQQPQTRQTRQIHLCRRPILRRDHQSQPRQALQCLFRHLRHAARARILIAAAASSRSHSATCNSAPHHRPFTSRQQGTSTTVPRIRS